MKTLGSIAGLLFLLWQTGLNWAQDSKTLHFRLLPEESEISAEVGALFGQTVVGKFKLHEGKAQGQISNLESTGSVTLLIQASSYDSGFGMRDQDVRENYLETSLYPQISFSSTGIKQIREPTSSRAAWHFTIQGDLTIHGVKRSVEVPINLTHAGEKMTAEGNMVVRFEDYHIQTPTVFFFQTQDQAKVKFRIVGTVQP